MLIGDSVPLIGKDEIAVAADGLFAFGLRISLLPRFCPLAMIGLLYD
jgi:hypothetical protein